MSQNDLSISSEKSNDSSSSSNKKEQSVENQQKIQNFLVHITIITEITKHCDESGSKCICQNNISRTKENENNVFTEIEIVPEVKVPISIEGENDVDNNNNNNLKKEIIQIKLSDLCNSLRLLGYPVTGSMINLYIKDVEDYVFFGADPIDSNVYIDSEQIDFSCLRIKLINYLDEKLLKRTREGKEGDDDDEGNQSDYEGEDDVNINEEGKKKEKRTKERKIGFIIEKVNAWRKLYNGFYDDKGVHVRYSLDQAAKMINISKKSLDDYLLQLRLGRKYGFDFNKNKNERVGKLRMFVKKYRNHEGIK